MIDVANYIKPLADALINSSNPERAAKMEAYLLHKFPFLGIMTTERRLILKNFYNNSAKLTWQQVQEVAMFLWRKPQREFHYCAIEFIAFYKKEMDIKFITTIEQLFLENSWWDSVDGTNSILLNFYFAKFPEQIQPITNHWNNSANIWLQRISIIYQLKAKQNTNLSILEKHILNCNGSKEFFVQKAIGWALREYAKTNAQWVVDFVAQNTLPSLSKREALKNLGNR